MHEMSAGAESRRKFACLSPGPNRSKLLHTRCPQQRLTVEESACYGGTEAPSVLGAQIGSETPRLSLGSPQSSAAARAMLVARSHQELQVRVVSILDGNPLHRGGLADSLNAAAPMRQEQPSRFWKSDPRQNGSIPFIGSSLHEARGDWVPPDSQPPAHGIYSCRNACSGSIFAARRAGM